MQFLLAKPNTVGTWGLKDSDTMELLSTCTDVVAMDSDKNYPRILTLVGEV